MQNAPIVNEETTDKESHLRYYDIFEESRKRFNYHQNENLEAQFRHTGVAPTAV